MIFLSIVQYGTSWLTYYLRKRDIQYLIEEREMLAKRQVKKTKKSNAESSINFNEDLDPESIPKPSVWNVFLLSIPRFIFRKITGTKSIPSESLPDDEEYVEPAVAPDSPQGKTRKRSRKARS
ncbi:DnaJ subfamily C member 1 [Basidiobolus ranarum]|uniref:DnaJ subfamily C member 1 n=1 Tax=Basidiobolus ranarum TaxID=34480 RepID=A0ABR2VVQ6_9FUNG